MVAIVVLLLFLSTRQYLHLYDSDLHVHKSYFWSEMLNYKDYTWVVLAFHANQCDEQSCFFYYEFPKNTMDTEKRKKCKSCSPWKISIIYLIIYFIWWFPRDLNFIQDFLSKYQFPWYMSGFQFWNFCFLTLYVNPSFECSYSKTLIVRKDFSGYEDINSTLLWSYLIYQVCQEFFRHFAPFEK